MDKLKIRLQPKQTALWNLWDDSDITEIGSGGARGGSKSGGGRRCMILRRFKYEKTTGLILRRTFKELYQSHIIKLYEEWPELAKFYNVTNKELLLPNGSRLFFGSAEHAVDMSSFYSAEYADIMVDEAQEFSQDELERLNKSNRCTSNARIVPKMVYTFMPGMSEAMLAPKGLPYLKRVFIEKKLKAEEKKEKWDFIQAYSWDNIEWARKELFDAGLNCGQHDKPDSNCDACKVEQESTFYSWPEHDRQEFFLEHTEYGRKLSALTNHGLRDAWLYGKWDTFQGQYFPQFKPDVGGPHVITRAELAERNKPWHKHWASGDWGYDHPHAIYKHAEDERGCVITYGEMSDREVNETDLAKRIGKAFGKMENGKLVSAEKWLGFPFSWDAGKLSKRADPKFPKSISQMITDALPDWMAKPHPAESSPGSRIAGARLLSQLLDSGMWQICEDCPRLIECLPTLVRDPDNPEDVLKVDYSENYIGDDPYDAVRMGLQYMLGSARTPVSVVAERRVAEFAKSRDMEVEDMDINTIAQLHRRATAQEQRRRRARKGGLGKVWRPQVN